MDVIHVIDPSCKIKKNCITKVSFFIPLICYVYNIYFKICSKCGKVVDLFNRQLESFITAENLPENLQIPFSYHAVHHKMSLLLRLHCDCRLVTATALLLHIISKWLLRLHCYCERETATALTALQCSSTALLQYAVHTAQGSGIYINWIINVAPRSIRSFNRAER